MLEVILKWNKKAIAWRVRYLSLFIYLCNCALQFVITYLSFQLCFAICNYLLIFAAVLGEEGC